MAASRLPRSETDQVFSNKANPAYSDSSKIEYIGKGLQLLTHQDDWQPIELDCEGIFIRTTSAALTVQGEHAASFKAVEYRLDPLLDSEEFFFWADGDSEAAGALAGVVGDYWEDLEDLTNFGSILDLRRAWIASRYSRNGHFGTAARALIDQFDQHAILVLKAFPLEYENQVGELTAEAYRRRKSAMMRHYQRELHVEAFPDLAGQEGWMYSIPQRLNGILSPPRSHKVRQQAFFDGHKGFAGL